MKAAAEVIKVLLQDPGLSKLSLERSKIELKPMLTLNSGGIAHDSVFWEALRVIGEDSLESKLTESSRENTGR